MKQPFTFSLLAFIVLFLFVATLPAQWVQVSGSYGGQIQKIAISDENLIAATAAGLFVSTNSGTSWTLANDDLTSVTSFALRSGNEIYAGTKDRGVLLSTNYGADWVAVNNGLKNPYVTSLAFNSSSVFAATTDSLYRSTDSASSWQSITDGIDLGIIALAAKDSLVFASTHNGVFRSTNNGESWARADSGLVMPRPPIRTVLYHLAITDSAIFGCSISRVYRSIDKGLSWHITGTLAVTGPLSSLVAIGTDIFASDGVSLFRSSDNGMSWNRVGSGLPRNASLTQTIYSLTTQGSTLFAGTIAGVFYSKDLGMHWRGLNNGLNASAVHTLIASSSNLFSDAGNGYFIQRSTDNGASWTVVNDTVYYHYRRLVSNGSYLVASTDGPLIPAFSSPILRSSDLGASWTSLGYQQISDALAMNDNYIFSGALYALASVIRCPNDSATWTVVNNGLPDSPGITTLVANGPYVFAGTSSDGIFYSSHNGTNWTALNSGWDRNLTVSAIAVNGQNIFAGAWTNQAGIIIPRGIFRTTDDGTTWTPVNNGLTDTTITALVIHGSTLLAGTNSGVFLSTNNGTTWTPFNNGLPSLEVSALALNETYVYAGIFGGVWRRPLSEAVTEVQSPHGNVPGQFRLEQNYPNPSNPTTTIKYSLAKSSRVTLKIFNLVGEELATLVNSQQTPGDHEIFWNAENFPTGIYYYQLRTDHNLIQTKKLVLLK